LLAVLAAKVAGAAFIYYSTNVGARGTFWSDPARVFNLPQNLVFQQQGGVGGNWPLMFVGWDSAWYLSILTHGYAFSAQTYTFSPGLPAAGAFVNFFFHNALTALVVCSFFSGLLVVPLLQLLLEEYIGKRAALAGALVFAFSPYIFVFTTVVYAEGLFLFFSLAAWLLFRRGKTAGASLLAGFAALTRVMGVLMVVPMFYCAVKKKGAERVRGVLLSFAPVLAIASWYLFCFVYAGDLLAPLHTTEWGPLYTVPTFLLRDIPQLGSAAFLQTFPPFEFWLSPAACTATLALPPLLIYKVAKSDKPLAIYALAGYFGAVAFGAIISLPRFMSVIFPLWIPLITKISLSKRQVVLIAFVVAAFFLVGVDMWLSFLGGKFVA
jgi:hypothetical protein